MREIAEGQVASMKKEPGSVVETLQRTEMVDSRELLLRHRSGDSEAFGSLVDAYRSPVYSYLIRCGVEEADRDDLFQDIFIKIHGAAAKYQENKPLHPWLFTIVANTVRTHFRKKRVRRLVFSTPLEREPVETAPSSEEKASARQTVDWLEKEIPRLPLPQREVLVLACCQSIPQAEIAAVLDMPLNTVKTHLRRARLKLVRLHAERNHIPKGSPGNNGEAHHE